MSANDSKKTKADFTSLFMVFLLTLIFGVPLVILILYEIDTHTYWVISLTIILLIVLTTIAFIIIAGKNWLLRKVEKLLQIPIEGVLAQISNLLGSVPGAKEEFDKAKETVNKKSTEALSAYAWIRLRLFIINSLLALFIGFGALLGSFLLYDQNKKIDKQNEKLDRQNFLITAQNKRIDQQTYLAEANRRSSLVFLFSNIMDNVDREIRSNKTYKDSLKKNPNTKFKAKLSPQLERRIIALSQSLKAYKFMDGDSLIKRPLSPERAQLLQALVGSNVFLDNILKNSSFAQADLKRVNLFRANLRSINLDKANLIEAHLNKIDLNHAKLRWADLTWANVNEANLVLADLRWADLKGVDLNGSSLVGAYLDNANLRSISLKHTNLSEASLEGANLSKADLRWADLRRTSLREVILPDITKMSNAKINLYTELNKAFTVDSQWLDKLNKTVQNDEKSPFNSNKYVLSKRLTLDEIKEFSKNNIYLRNWNPKIPLYLIRSKSEENLLKKQK